jgi:cysteine desulfurase/selenocysteine lyase
VTRPAPSEGPRLDVAAVRRDFPALHQEIHGHPLVYLDSGATAHKPQVVIDAVRDHYMRDCANIHRGVHTLSQRATIAYEAARGKVRRFLGADSDQEILFVRGTTEAINLVAQSWGRANLGPGDEVLVTGMEHHSNIVPWQLLGAQTGCVLKHVPLEDDGSISLDRYRELLTPRVKLVSVIHISNALGTVNPVAEMIALAHEQGAKVLVDGAQSAPHQAIDVQALDCDFFAFSGHKVYGPSGVGVLYGKRALLEAMPPWQGGGDMIRTVSFEGSTWAALPNKFEAGTPMIAQVIGLGVALDYLSGLGLHAVARHEAEVLAYGTARLGELDYVRLVGTAPHKAAVLSFVVADVHPHDVGTILDMEGVAVRAGHHSAQPVMARFGVPATTRASLGVYSTTDDVDRLVAALGRVQELFGG